MHSENVFFSQGNEAQNGLMNLALLQANYPRCTRDYIAWDGISIETSYVAATAQHVSLFRERT